MPDSEITIVRRVRHEISQECGHRVDGVVAYYRAVEDELRRSGEFRFEQELPIAETTQDATGPSVAGSPRP